MLQMIGSMLRMVLVSATVLSATKAKRNRNEDGYWYIDVDSDGNVFAACANLIRVGVKCEI